MCNIRNCQSKLSPSSLHYHFYSFIKNHFLNEYENIKKRLEKEIIKEKRTVSEELTATYVGVYNLKAYINYELLLPQITEIYNKLK